MTKGSKRLIGLGIVLLLCVLARGFLGFTLRTESGGRGAVEAYLKNSPLGPLPTAATNVLLRSWNGPFTGETWIRFELPVGTMEAFIAASPALAGVVPKERYDRDHPLLPFPEEFYTNGPGVLKNHPADAHFHGRRDSDPDWYVTSIQGKGRMYFLWPNAWVHIDEELGIVWIKVVKG